MIDNIARCGILHVVESRRKRVRWKQSPMIFELRLNTSARRR